MYLLDKNNNELLKFNVNLGQLSFLGKEMRNVSIYHYPIIIFEFMTGYFTTEDLYKKNREIELEFTKDYEIFELPKDSLKAIKSTMTIAPGRNISPNDNNDSKDNKKIIINLNPPNVPEKENEIHTSKKNLAPDTKSYNIHTEEFKNQLDINLRNQIEMKNSNRLLNTMTFQSNEIPVQKNEIKDNLEKYSSTDNSSSSKKKKTEKKNIPEVKAGRYPSTPFSQYILTCQMLDYLINPQENIKETNPNFGKELEIFNEQIEKHKRKLRIIEMEKEIEFLTKKNSVIKDLNKDLEEAVNRKKENIKKVTEQLKPNQISYANKLNQLKNNLKSKGQYQLLYDSFVYQKMAEVCFVFFNNKIDSLYTIPKFYNEPLSYSDFKKNERLEFYNSEKKNISAMMGHICQLLIYLSKTFNIPLRFPIFLNGSKSYILRSVKDKVFLPLYFDAKKDDKHGNFENALNCLKDDIKEIFNFLSMFPEIISKNDNENVNNMNGKYLFFFFFVVFNHSLFRFIKTLQNAI